MRSGTAGGAGPVRPVSLSIPACSTRRNTARLAVAIAGVQGCIVRTVKIQLLVKVMIQMMVDVGAEMAVWVGSSEMVLGR